MWEILAEQGGVQEPQQLKVWHLSTPSNTDINVDHTRCACLAGSISTVMNINAHHHQAATQTPQIPLHVFSSNVSQI